MKCQVIGCNLQSYHYNPLINTFNKCWSKVIRIGDALPKKGVFFEIIKRICRCIAVPFLAIGALFGLILDVVWKKQHTTMIKSWLNAKKRKEIKQKTEEVMLAIKEELKQEVKEIVEEKMKKVHRKPEEIMLAIREELKQKFKEIIEKKLKKLKKN